MKRDIKEILESLTETSEVVQGDVISYVPDWAFDDVVKKIESLNEEKEVECRECGGNCKPSKGILNTHDIRTQNPKEEFKTEILDCLKCEDCGHSFTIAEDNSESVDVSIHKAQINGEIFDVVIADDLKKVFKQLSKKNTVSDEEIKERALQLYDKTNQQHLTWIDGAKWILTKLKTK